MSRKKTVMTVLLAAVLFTGCGVQSAGEKEQTALEEQKASQKVFAMDTYMTVTAYGAQAEEAVSLAAEEIRRLDSLLSPTGENSEVAAINRDGKGTLSQDTAYLLKQSLELYESTGGAFDVAISPVVQAWGFLSGDYRVPAQETLYELLPLTDASLIQFEESTGETVLLQEGMQLDFGGIAKGYTSSRIMEIYRDMGITCGMVNLGGNVQVLGERPKGGDWRVGIRNPDREDTYLGVLSVRDKAVITSGGYERYFEKDGTIYHHIIDPASGYPAQSGLVSVTVVSKDGTLADALSTSLFIMGEEKAVEYWRAHAEEFGMLLLTDKGRLLATEDIAEDFDTDQSVEIIRKGD